MRRKAQGGRRHARGDTAPVRMCVSCRTVESPEQLLRFIRAPSGTVHFDVSGRMPGRGAYTCASAACVTRAVDKGGFRRAFDEAVLFDGEGDTPARRLMRAVDEVLEAEALRHLSLLFASSTATIGRERALDAYKAHPAGYFVFACDLAEGSVREVQERSAEAVHLFVGTKSTLADAVGADKPVGVVFVQKKKGASERLNSHLSRRAALSAEQAVGPKDGAPLRGRAKNIEAASVGVGTPG